MNLHVIKYLCGFIWTFQSSLLVELFIFLFLSIFLATMASNRNNSTRSQSNNTIKFGKNGSNQSKDDDEFIEFEKGWEFMQRGFEKLSRIVEGHQEAQFTSEGYMKLYATVYKLCTQDPLNDYSQKLYDKYREIFEVYITSTVLPALREKKQEGSTLHEIVTRWKNHKIMIRWMTRFFHYLERYFIAKRSLPGLEEVAFETFRNLVYDEVRVDARVAVMDLIQEEREGGEIDREMVKNVVEMFVEIGNGKMDAYENDLEVYIVEKSGDYYYDKASSWIVKYSNEDYMLKVEECLRMEKERVGLYLHPSSEQKMVKKVRDELMEVYANNDMK